MEALPYISYCWSVFELFRSFINAYPDYPTMWAYVFVGSNIFVCGAGLIYDMHKTYDKLDWRHCLKINDYYGSPVQQKMLKGLRVGWPVCVVGAWFLFSILYNTIFWKAVELTIYPMAVMYASVFKFGPHNPNMLTRVSNHSRQK